MSGSVTYWRRALEHSVYSDLLPPESCHAAFGMHNDDNQLNSMVLGCWQGALKYLLCVALEQLNEAIAHNKVSDLFVQTTKLMAGYKHPWSVKLLDRLDEVVFEPILIEEGPLPFDQYLIELGHDARDAVSRWQLFRLRRYPWLDPLGCRHKIQGYKRQCREIKPPPDSVRKLLRALSSCT